MKIKKFDIYEYGLPLKRAIPTKQEPMKVRRGFIIKLEDDKGHVGVGEIAPFPFLHQETFEEAREELFKVRQHLLGSEVFFQYFAIEDFFLTFDFLLDYAPSVCFGVEMAFLHLWALDNNKSITALLSDSSAKEVPVNGLLLADNEEELIAQAEEKLQQGYTTLKLKIGRHSVEADIEMVKKLQSLVQERASIRLDANQAWNYHDAVAFGKGVGPKGIDYIEEPIQGKQLDLLSDFYEATKIPYAFDESLLMGELRNITKTRGLKALVMKPSALGLRTTFEMITFAEEQKLLPVVSSTFESSVGISFLIQIAASIGGGHTGAGLDTFHWFQEDLLNIPLKVLRGHLELTPLQKSTAMVRNTLLQKIQFDSDEE